MKKSVRKSIGKRQPHRKIGKESAHANHRGNHVDCEKHAHICNFIHYMGNESDTDLKV